MLVYDREDARIFNVDTIDEFNYLAIDTDWKSVKKEFTKNNGPVFDIFVVVPCDINVQSACLFLSHDNFVWLGENNCQLWFGYLYTLGIMNSMNFPHLACTELSKFGYLIESVRFLEQYQMRALNYFELSKTFLTISHLPAIIALESFIYSKKYNAK